MKVRFFTIPNLLTLSNLMCGTFAALSALVFDNLEWAFWFVILAAVFDFFDGFAARLLRQSSPIGVQLDSLADMISFGFVPAAVLYAMTTRTMGEEQVLLRYAFAFASFLLAAFGPAPRQIQHRRFAARRVLRPSDAGQRPVLRLAGTGSPPVRASISAESG